MQQVSVVIDDPNVRRRVGATVASSCALASSLTVACIILILF